MSQKSGNSRNGNNNGGGGSGGSGGGSGGSGGGGSRKRKGRKKPKLDPVKYWGDAGVLPVRDDYVLQTADPTTVIRSLGKAPIPGKNSAPELYFEVLYQRAAGLAQALAIAGNLNAEIAETTKPVTAPDAASD